MYVIFNNFSDHICAFQEISRNRVIIKEGTICLQSIRKPYRVLEHFNSVHECMSTCVLLLKLNVTTA